jgi:uncharacterized protein
LTAKMNYHILFLQGGAGGEDHDADSKIVHSLQKHLGNSYTIDYPLLPNEESLPDFGRMKQIDDAISSIEGDIVVVAHSLGASMLLKYLSERTVSKNVIGIFLLATPFWSGDEDWKQGLKLQSDFANRLPMNLPIFLYHCRDDEEVPFEQFAEYRRKLATATFRELEFGGHQFNNDILILATDIKGLVGRGERS